MNSKKAKSIVETIQNNRTFISGNKAIFDEKTILCKRAKTAEKSINYERATGIEKTKERERAI